MVNSYVQIAKTNSFINMKVTLIYFNSLAKAEEFYLLNEYWWRNDLKLSITCRCVRNLFYVQTF